MHQSLGRYSAPVSFVHAPSLAGFITTMVGFKVFGTHSMTRCVRKVVRVTGTPPTACRSTVRACRPTNTAYNQHTGPGTGDPDARKREGHHANTRGFASVASCAICGLAGFVTTDASAQGAQPATSGGVTRKMLSQIDGPVPGYTTIVMDVTIEPGVAVARHTHPGIESSYVVEGGGELLIEGQPTRLIKAGEAFQIPAETPHAGGKPGDTKTRLLTNYIVEKDKPLVKPV
jgi:quercetin dioxygenase-like cupin family protein